jgi:hypothetical protein
VDPADEAPWTRLNFWDATGKGSEDSLMCISEAWISVLVVGTLLADHPDYREPDECSMFGAVARQW